MGNLWEIYLANKDFFNPSPPAQVQLAEEAPGGAGHRPAAGLGRGAAPGREAAKGQGAAARFWAMDGDGGFIAYGND